MKVFLEPFENPEILDGPEDGEGTPRCGVLVVSFHPFLRLPIITWRTRRGRREDHATADARPRIGG